MLNQQILTQTIDPATFSLADWLKIAAAIEVNNPQKWAYYRWLANTTIKLSSLTLGDWEAIEVQTGHNEGWAYHRMKEYRD